MDRADVDAVILAGGRARRLGGLDKGALVFEGRTLVSRALEAATVAGNRVVVGNPALAEVPSGVRVVRERPVFSGPASAVMAGVDALAEAGSTATWVLVLACDVVRSGDLTGALLEAAEGHPDADGVVPVDEESRRQMLVGLYRRSALSAARDGIGDVADLSMKRLLESLRLIEVMAGRGAAADVDTPEQARVLGIELPAAGGQPPWATLRTPSVADARRAAHQVGASRLTPQVRVAVESAAGLTLAADIAAAAPVPAFANSAMDGWAVAGDGPWRLGKPIHAGDDIDESPLDPGSAHQIMTGAAVPPATWAVVRREDGIVGAGGDGGQQLSLRPGLDAPRQGHHIRPSGEEAAQGEIVLGRGQVLTPPRLGLAAACSIDEVPVRRAPTVDIVVVGDELVDRGRSGDGKVRDAITPQLLPIMEGGGARVVGAARVGDDVEAIRAAIERSRAELVVVTGGTSMGAADHTRAVLGTMGARLIVDGIASRPGRPALVAELDRCVVICLPGNPLAAIVAALVLVIPMVEGMLGRPPAALTTARLAVDLPNIRQDSLLVPCRLAPDGSAVPTGWSDSGMVRGLANADTIAIVPPGGSPPDRLVDALALHWT